MSMERCRKTLRTTLKTKEVDNSADYFDQGIPPINLPGKRSKIPKGLKRDPKLRERDNYRTAFGKQPLSKSKSCSNTKFTTSSRFPAELKAEEHKRGLGPGVYETIDKSNLSGSRSAASFSLGTSKRPSPARRSATNEAALMLPTINAIGSTTKVLQNKMHFEVK